jgi:hypothetical protein
VLVYVPVNWIFFSNNPDDFGAVFLWRLPPCVSFSIRLLGAYSF